jgi:glutamate/tyrosine decarboxylase-like PLP-dependent enzyme
VGAPEVVAADEQGRLVPEALREALGKGPTIVCAQAGDVNSGAFDPLPEIADACEAAGAWLHVDGAFGIWAAVSPRFRHLVDAIERADSWTTDAHKWLQVPYDSGLVFCKHPESHRAAMTVTTSYLIQDAGEQRVRDAVDWVPEFSRRARGFAVYAALRSLGRRGLRELVERCCDAASRFAERIVEVEGAEVLNDVVLNQVLVRFETDERTDAIVERIQSGGRVWLGGTTWRGRRAIRVSVSNWQTGDEEIDLAVEAFAEAYARPAFSSAVDRSLQTDARTQLARPDGDVARDA